MSDKEFGGTQTALQNTPPSNQTPGDTDLSLPKATVQKIISEVLAHSPPPPSQSTTKDSPDKESHLTFTRPARDLLISCSLEFLRMLSSEANEISEKDSKKTISIDHIETALTELGFGSYIPGCREVVGEWQETQKKRTGRGERMRDFGGMKGKMTDEELLRMQEELLKGAGGGGAE
jgi:down-regulator of transcription 1